MSITVEMPSGKVSIKGVDAAPPPPANTSEQSTRNQVLTTLVELVCGVFCKDTPLTELIPAPTEVSQATATFNGMSE